MLFGMQLFVKGYKGAGERQVIFKSLEEFQIYGTDKWKFAQI
jgi:hypothetical protein